MSAQNPTVGWLTGEPGQAVAVYDGRTAELTAVDKYTPTQVVVGQYRYWRKDGLRLGASFYGERLLPVDHPDVQKALRSQAYEWADNNIYLVFRQYRNLNAAARTDEARVKALREVLGLAAQAMTVCAGAPLLSDGGEAAETHDAAARAAVRAYNCAVARELGHGDDGPTAWGPDADDALLSNAAYRAGLVAHERSVLAHAVARVRERMHPPRLGGTAYWHGLNDAALLIERKALDEQG